MKTIVTVALALGLCSAIGRADEKQDGPKPLPPEIVKAWTDAGARVGWMDRFMHFHEGQGEKGEAPAFRFDGWTAGIVAKLPSPQAAFGLDLNSSRVTDAQLKELAALKNLQSLNLFCTNVTDAGLKELAGLKRLQ